MADDIDKAQATNELFDAILIQNHRHQSKTRELEPDGYCHVCGESVHNNRIFCTSECRDDYERIKRSRSFR